MPWTAPSRSLQCDRRPTYFAPFPARFHSSRESTMAKVRPIPEGCHSLMPHIAVRDAAGAIEFYKKAFGAKELGRHAGPGGKIMHAALQIGDSRLLLNDEFPEFGACGPTSAASSPVTIHMFVEDVDKMFAQAVAAGAKATMPVMDQFWGDRYGKLED